MVLNSPLTTKWRDLKFALRMSVCLSVIMTLCSSVSLADYFSIRFFVMLEDTDLVFGDCCIMTSYSLNLFTVWWFCDELGSFDLENLLKLSLSICTVFRHAWKCVFETLYKVLSWQVSYKFRVLFQCDGFVQSNYPSLK